MFPLKVWMDSIFSRAAFCWCYQSAAYTGIYPRVNPRANDCGVK